MKIKICEPGDLSSKSLTHKDFKAAFKSKTAKDLNGIAKSAPVDYFILVNHAFKDKLKKKLAFVAVGDQTAGWANLLKDLKKNNKKNLSIGKCYVEADEKGAACLCLMHQEGGAKKGTIMKQVGAVAKLDNMSLRVVGAEEGDDPEALEENDEEDLDDDAENAVPPKSEKNKNAENRQDSKTETPVQGNKIAQNGDDPASKTLSEIAILLEQLLPALQTIKEKLLPLFSKKRKLSDQQIKYVEEVLGGLKKVAQKYALLSTDQRQKAQPKYQRANPETNIAQLEKMLALARKEAPVVPTQEPQPTDIDAAKRREQAMMRVRQIRQRLSEIAQELANAQ